MTSWIIEAACAERPQLFDTPKGHVLTNSDRQRYEKADAICAGCPVIDNCRRDPEVQQSEGFRHRQLFTGPNLTEVTDWGNEYKPLRFHPDFMKNCPTCNTEKSLNDFQKNAKNRDALMYECRACVSHRAATNYAKRQAVA